jgi:hypothetical protein
MNSALKTALAASAAVAVAIAGCGAGSVAPSPVASSAPVASPSPDPSPSLQGDRMTLEGTTRQFAVQLPEGWENGGWIANDHESGGNSSFVVTVVDNTMADPCGHIERSPRIGATVEDLTAALGEIPTTTATVPVKATIAGYEATYVEVALAGSPPCDQFVWLQAAPDRYLWAIDDDEQIRVWIIEPDGMRVAVVARSYPSTRAASKVELQKALDSIVFDSAP